MVHITELRQVVEQFDFTDYNAEGVRQFQPSGWSVATTLGPES